MMLAKTEEYRIRILQISDLHERGTREKSGWRRRRVLGPAWKANLTTIAESGPVDLVVFTGDIADWGMPDEYEQATSFVDGILGQLGLERERLFVVPGNHDIQRPLKKPLWAKFRKNALRANAQDLSRWMANTGGMPLGFTASQADAILERQTAFRSWVAGIGRPELLPSASRHPRLGYRATVRLPGRPFEIHVIGLDSGWLAGDDNDAGKLVLTEDQVMLLASDQGTPLNGFRLALVHHPLEDMADASQCRRHLAENVDLLLRGHLHDPEPQLWADPERTLQQLAAGCLYEGERADRYPNSCHLIDVVLDHHGKPLRYEVWFRGWSERGHWFDYDGLYAGTKNGRLTIEAVARPDRSTDFQPAIEVGAATPSDPADPTSGDRRPAQTPGWVRETVYSSLLPVERMPRYVYGGPCEFSGRQHAEVRERIIYAADDQFLPFILQEGRLYCFQDLTNPANPFRRVVPFRQAFRDLSRDWWQHQDHAIWFIDLLNRSLNRLLGSRKVPFDRDHKRYRFVPLTTGERRREKYRPLNNKVSELSVVWQPESKKYGPREYWIHRAAALRFHRVGDEDWALSIRPDFHFTKDSILALPSEEIGPLATSRKSDIHNYDLLKEINFWRDFLGKSSPRIVITFDDGPQKLVIGMNLMSSAIEWPGIPVEFSKKFRNTNYQESDESLVELASLDGDFGEDIFDEEALRIAAEAEDGQEDEW